MPENLYDNHEFNEKYAQMERSVIGLEAAGEWPQLKELLGDMKDKDFIEIIIPSLIQRNGIIKKYALAV